MTRPGGRPQAALRLGGAGRFRGSSERDFQRQVELLVPPLAGRVDEAREGGFAHVLSDAHAQTLGLSLERLP